MDTPSKPLINLDLLTMSQIRAELKKLGLSQHGIKAILLNRLKQAVRNGSKLSSGEVDPASLIHNVEIPTPAPRAHTPPPAVSRPTTRSVRQAGPPPVSSSLSKADQQKIQQILQQTPALMNSAHKVRESEAKKQKKSRNDPRTRSREQTPSSSSSQEDESRSEGDSDGSSASSDDQKGTSKDRSNKHKKRKKDGTQKLEPIIVKKMRNQSREPGPHKEFFRQAQMELMLEHENESYDREWQHLIFEYKLLKDELIAKEKRIVDLYERLFELPQNQHQSQLMESLQIPEPFVANTSEEIDNNWQLLAKMALITSTSQQTI